MGVDHLPAGIIDSKVISNLTNYLNIGGNIFLTKHATQLITALGRIPDQYGPHLFGDGEGGEGSDIWTTNAVIGSNCDPKYDHRSHAAFAGLEVLPPTIPWICTTMSRSRSKVRLPRRPQLHVGS